jgi:CO/xanthine dehydrogenase FAD-binding subunit
VDYARPREVREAIELLARPGARALAGGTDLAGQLDRGLAAPELLVDLQGLGLGEIRAADGGIEIGGTVSLAELVQAPLVAPYTVVTAAASLAASQLLRNVGTVAGNLCQWTRCWYLRGVEWNCWLGGGEHCYAQLGDHRKHGLQPGECISAHPSDLAPALAACGARVIVAGEDGTRDLDLLDLYRRPTQENRSLLTLGRGEIVLAVRLPAPPEASSYERLGERRQFSFPLVSVAAARRDGGVSMVAAGVANVPVALDPADPLADLPGNPHSAWKRKVVTTLAERALAALENRRPI